MAIRARIVPPTQATEAAKPGGCYPAATTARISAASSATSMGFRIASWLSSRY
jgi:hypothetical protein